MPTPLPPLPHTRAMPVADRPPVRPEPPRRITVGDVLTTVIFLCAAVVGLLVLARMAG